MKLTAEQYARKYSGSDMLTVEIAEHILENVDDAELLYYHAVIYLAADECFARALSSTGYTREP